MDVWFSSYGKNKFLLYVFLHPIVFWTIRKMSLGCDAGLKMIEERFEDYRRIYKSCMKIPCSPNYL